MLEMIEMRNFASLLIVFTLATTRPASAAVETFTDESAYLAALAAHGYDVLIEDFEGAAWNPYRTTNPFDPQAAATVTSLGITWSGNDLLSTNLNWGRNSTWGVFTIFSGGVPTPDTLLGQSVRPLYAVGGWINGNPDFGADIGIVIDGQVVVDRNIGTGHQFLGVIVTTGFTTFEIIDIEQQTAWGADDFRLGIQAAGTGDIDGDGDVDLTDLAILLSQFDLCIGDPGFNPAADVDGNGCVDLTDLALLLANFNG